MALSNKESQIIGMLRRFDYGTLLITKKDGTIQDVVISERIYLTDEDVEDE